MDTGFPFLSATVFLPLVGALFILLFIHKGEDAERTSINARNAALWVTVATFLLSLILYWQFNPVAYGFQFEEHLQWFEGYQIGYHLGLDAISLYLVLLTTFLMPICILASWRNIKTQVREYMIAFLLLETFVIGTFAALDFVLFYVFFEGSLIPMFLIIGIWGGENRVYAAFKFFLYTLLGSVLLLLALLYLYLYAGTTDIPALMALAPQLGPRIQMWLWLAFFASFAVKVPMWPVHTWLPDAHVQAPTAGSVILAGILLKLGGYGFMRFSLPMLPDASIHFAPLIFLLSAVAVVYTSFVALMQKDMKKLIAYSSVAHMGLVTAGLFAFNIQAVQGAYFQMISHGLVSAALFLCVGVLYDRLHTKEIAKFGGLTERMPRFAAIFMFFVMAGVGLPGTSGFVGEFLVILGVFKSSTIISGLLATGLVLGAAYMLWLYWRVMFGEITRDELKTVLDISRRELLLFVPIVLLVLLIGIYPSLILKPLELPISFIQMQMGL
ncbi:MAG: NADH-quinone oxidoreductase subunit M [Hyphomicrobiales bacterium]|nr:NADH-quinone oxidoreductase subunit M [Hyphomicrobiales bacterium]